MTTHHLFAALAFTALPLTAAEGTSTTPPSPAPNTPQACETSLHQHHNTPQNRRYIADALAANAVAVEARCTFEGTVAESVQGEAAILVQHFSGQVTRSLKGGIPEGARIRFVRAFVGHVSEVEEGDAQQHTLYLFAQSAVRLPDGTWELKELDGGVLPHLGEAVREVVGEGKGGTEE